MEIGMWHLVREGKFPKKHINESSRPVLVRYADETADPEVCRYNFITKKFVFGDIDVTANVIQWHEIPK